MQWAEECVAESALPLAAFHTAMRVVGEEIGEEATARRARRPAPLQRRGVRGPWITPVHP